MIPRDPHRCPYCEEPHDTLTTIRLADGTGSLVFVCTDCDYRWAAYNLPASPHGAETAELEGSG